MLPDERRDRLRQLAERHATSHADLSRLLRRGDAYFGRYVREKVPYDLAEADSRLLARYFGVDEETLREVPRKPAPRLSRYR